MLFAVNPGAEGSANSSAFKAAALAIGAQLAKWMVRTRQLHQAPARVRLRLQFRAPARTELISMNTGGANAMLMGGLGMSNV